MGNNYITETTQYLTFRLGDEIFAVNVSQVREVLDVYDITSVPQSLDFIKGVINVHGSVVPVVDLRLKFGMSSSEQSIDSRVVVMELSIDGEETVLGSLADSVHEVMDLGPEQVEALPSIGSRRHTEFIKGIGKRDDDFIIILDINRIFSTDELTTVQESSGPTDEQQEDKKAA
jgi:purine-binding chemotaxis protein CheW